MINLKSIFQTNSWRSRSVLFAISGVLFLLILINGCGRSSGEQLDFEGQLDRFFTVARGDFNITVLSHGELDAIKKHELYFEGAGRHSLRVEQIVEDQAQVKKGDIVVKLADEDYIENITLVEQEIQDIKSTYDDKLALEKDLHEMSMRISEESLNDAELNINIFLESQSLDRDNLISSLTEANNALETARDALNRYNNLDYRTQSKEKQAVVDQKEQEYYDALDELDKANSKLSEARLKDEVTREKAERMVIVAEKKVSNALSGWENTRKGNRRFRRYDHPQTLRKLTMATEKAELSLKRKLVMAESNRIQNDRQYRILLREKENLYQNIKERKDQYSEELERLEGEFNVKLERLNERLVELKADLEGLVMRAPIDGVVTIGAPTRRGREKKEILVGTTVSPREVIAVMPDLSQFLIRCDIPEIYRSRISIGQPVMLRNAALPNLRMQGSVNDIANMSKRFASWDPNSPRSYETKISTNSSDPRLMPGMTVEVEILVDEVKDVCFIPIEAAYNKEGKTYCRVKSGFSNTEVEIKTGRSSNSYIEIVEGLEEGDIVLLHDATGASRS